MADHADLTDSARVRVLLPNETGIHALIARRGQAAALASRLGFADASRPRALRNEGHDIVAIGPGKWLIVGDVSEDVLARAHGEIAAIVGLDSAYRRLSLVGAGVRGLLAKGLPLDIETFAPGEAAVSSVAGVNLVLWMVEPDRFELAVTRSCFKSFWHWLEAAAPRLEVAGAT